MRFVTWNCRIGGFRWKAEHVASLRPDVLAVQEVEPIDDLLVFAGDSQPTFRDRSTAQGFPRRGLGMFSYTQTVLQSVDGAEPFSGIRRYEALSNGLSFNVIGVWTWGTGSARSAYRQAHEGLSVHRAWIHAKPTVVLGDFNANASFTGRNWNDLKALTDELELESAYHWHFKDAFGRECSPTYFHLGKETARCHLDYCFIPKSWTEHLTKVEVGTYDEWHSFSDHAPLIVDLAL
jgi:exonuclease III